VVLTTARLRLRELCPEDAAFVLALMNEPSFIEHIGDRGVRSVADAERYIIDGPWTRADLPGGGLLLVESISTGEPMGICGLLKRDWLPHPDIGFAFRPAYWSRGYALEAATAVKSFAGDVLQTPQLLAIVDPSNAASIRLLERLGFVFERITRATDFAAEIALYATAFDTIPRR